MRLKVVGSVLKPAGRDGYLLGAFLPPKHPFFSENVEMAWQIIGPDDLSKARKHRHEKTEEIFLALKGGITLAVQAEELILSKGEFVLVKPGQTH